MRQRHTSRTDLEDMGGTKVPVTFRLGVEARDRLLAASQRRMPDIANISDALQDAVWLWLHEDELINGKQDRPSSGGGVGTPPHKSEEGSGTVEVGESFGSSEGSTGDGTPSYAGGDSIAG